MTITSLVLGAMGVGLTFMPHEIAEILGMGAQQATVLSLQILGATYLGFSFLNWMCKSNLMGVIYGKPLIVGNLAHFFISSFALIKIVLKSENQLGLILFLTITYTLLTLCFGHLFFLNPTERHNKI